MVLAAREPWHREALGYTGRGAPSDHAEYLFALRDNRLILNLFDAPDPKYINRAVIDKAIGFMDVRMVELWDAPEADSRCIMVACNQGRSRSPTIAMLWMAPGLPENYDEAVKLFTEKHYPDYAPGEGMSAFARIHWRHYRNRGTAKGGAPVKSTDYAVDMAQKIWATFCDDLKSDPNSARDRLISSISTALRTAADGKMPTQET